MIRQKRNMEFPATLVHVKNGRQYKLEGSIVAINESAGTCSMKFAGHPIQRGIPMSKVYINEGMLDTIKDTLTTVGSKIKNAIVGLIKTAAGFIFPEYADGNVDTYAMASPVNQAILQSQTPLNKQCFNVVLADSTINYYKSIGINLKKNKPGWVNSDDSDGINACNTFWMRVMKDYVTEDGKCLLGTPAVQGDTDSDELRESYSYRRGKKHVKTLSESIANVMREQYVDMAEPYFNNKHINEVATYSQRDYTGGTYGTEVTKTKLMQIIKKNVSSFLNATIKDKPNNVMIWGAPGIGKTAIIKEVLSDFANNWEIDMAQSYLTCAGFHSDSAFLPIVVNRDGNNGMQQVVAGVKNYDNGQVEANPDETVEFGKNFVQPDEKGKVYQEQLGNGYSQENLIGVKISTAPMLMLPIYPYAAGMSKELEIARDEFINSGKHLDPQNNKTGGILFVDEFSALPAESESTMMAIMNERKNNDWKVASRWCILGASNRYSDMGLDEKTEGMDNPFNIRGFSTARVSQRCVHVHYVPSVNEWLEWARRKTEHTLPDGTVMERQNVDDLILQFITTSDNPAAILNQCVIAPPSMDNPLSVVGFGKSTTKTGDSAGTEEGTEKPVGSFDAWFRAMGDEDAKDISKLRELASKKSLTDDEYADLAAWAKQINTRNSYSQRTWTKNVWEQMYNDLYVIFLGMNTENATSNDIDNFRSIFDTYGNVDFNLLAAALKRNNDPKTNPAGAERWEHYKEEFVGLDNIKPGMSDIQIILESWKDIIRTVFNRSDINYNPVESAFNDSYLDYQAGISLESFYNVWKFASFANLNRIASGDDKDGEQEHIEAEDNIARFISDMSDLRAQRWKSLSNMSKSIFSRSLYRYPFKQGKTISETVAYDIDKLNMRLLATLKPEYIEGYDKDKHLKAIFSDKEGNGVGIEKMTTPNNGRIAKLQQQCMMYITAQQCKTVERKDSDGKKVKDVTVIAEKEVEFDILSYLKNNMKDIEVDSPDGSGKVKVTKEERYNILLTLLCESMFARNLFMFTLYWVKQALEISRDGFVLKGWELSLKKATEYEFSANTFQDGQRCTIAAAFGMKDATLTSYISGSHLVRILPYFAEMGIGEKAAAKTEVCDMFAKYNPFMPAWECAKLYPTLKNAKVCDGQTIAEFTDKKAK